MHAAGSPPAPRTPRQESGFAILVLTLVLALGPLGCAFLPGATGPSVPPEQRAAYNAALAFLPGDARAAERALSDFVAAYPQSLLADDALEEMSQIAFAGGRQEDGIRYLGRILSDHPTGDRNALARLRLARLEYARDDRVSARRLISPIDLTGLSLADQRAALRLKVSLAQTPVERFESLVALREVLNAESRDRKTDPAARSRLEGRLASVDRDLAALISTAATAELEDMIRGLRGRPPAAAIGLELTGRAIDSGQIDLANRRLKRTERLVTTDADRARISELRDRIERMKLSAQADAELPRPSELLDRPRLNTDNARGTIGVVLPLSGDFADYGEESLRGILLASRLFSAADPATMAERTASAATADNSDNSDGLFDDYGAGALSSDGMTGNSNVRIVVRDSAGDPGKAAQAVRELSRDPGLLAVIGPIFSQESVAAAEAAEESGVPLVALSTREDVPANRSYAFRTRTTPGDEVRVLVSHAFENLQAKRFAVLYPQTRYGRGMRKLYWEAVTERGGKMVAASSYDPESVDFATEMRNMIGYRFLTRWERKALAQREEILRASRRLKPKDAGLLREAAYNILGPELEPLPPIVDFDVLFIPDQADKIALIAPGLAFHEIRNVKLLGSSDWLDDELLRVGRQHVSGAVISSPFNPESELPFVAEFVEGYRNTFGEEPGAYAAEAYDATNLVMVQLASGVDGRGELRDGLLDMRAVPGATGVLTMHPNGNARRRPFLLRVSGGRFRPLD